MNLLKHGKAGTQSPVPGNRIEELVLLLETHL